MVEPDVDAVIVGAGFAGLYMLHSLREAGFTARVFDVAPDVGGTWYWNCYPGARCDIESMQYSYQFSEELQQEWTWTERYASQPELLSYIRHVADRFDLRSDITFETRVGGARFDDDSDLWTVDLEPAVDLESVATGTTRGVSETVSARFVILGSGCLSTINTPNFADADRFEGVVVHTARWPQDGIDFTGQRVGMIGTGSSAVQSIPHIAAEADRLFVFQRTANYVVPARNHPLTPEMVAEIKDDYTGFRARAKERPSAFLFPFNPAAAVETSDEERRQRFDAQWEIGGLPFLGAFGDLLTNRDSNALVTDYWSDKLREVIDDPAVAELLIPEGEIFGGKRLCAGTDYYETYNRPNVELVDVRGAGIERLTPSGLIADGVEYDVDTIVYATGFDAMTGSVVRIDIAGPDGTTIADRWRYGPDNYLGLSISGFPNLFNLLGPGAPSVFATMVTGAEHQGDWITELLVHMRDSGHTRVEAEPDAEAGWVAEVNRLADASLRSKAASWYLGSNIEGKARVFMPYIGGFPTYASICADVAADTYRGFTLS